MVMSERRRGVSRLLLAVLAAATSASSANANGLTIETAAPVGDSVCLVCDNNADCSGYADYSICLRGQCTTDHGLFGLGCKCGRDEECATARCDGIFQQTCRLQKTIGTLCNDNADCLSDRCSVFFMCAEKETTTRTEEPTQQQETEEQMDGSNNSTTTPSDLTLEELMSCKECEEDTECGLGFCVDRVCTDPVGDHPPFCVQCVDHDECATGYFCDGDLKIGQTGRKCQAKKRNGQGCNRRDECRSDHCNILWRCESTAPDQLRNPDFESDAGGGPSAAGILIWLCVAAGILAFGTSSFVFCRKDGFRKTFGHWRGSAPKEANNAAEVTDTSKPDAC